MSRRWPFVALALLVSLSWAGCFGQDAPEATDAPPTTSPSPYDTVAGFTLGLNSTKCREGDVIVLVELARLQSQLPAGFKAKDAQELLGSPVATNKGAVFLYSWVCLQSDIGPDGLKAGGATIFVEAPRVANVTAGGYNFYELATWTNVVELLEMLEAVNWTVVEGANTAQVLPTAAGGGATANGNVQDETGVVFSFGATAPGSDRLAIFARFWQNIPGGLGFFEFKFNTQGAFGSATCSLRSGSVPANATGFTSCPTGDSVGLAIVDTAWTSSFTFLPGVRATA